MIPADSPRQETGLTTDLAVTRICGMRDAALAKMAEAADMIERGHALAAEASELADKASCGMPFTLVDRRNTEDYGRLFARFDKVASLKVWKHHVDASVWRYVASATGLDRLMDAQAKQEFYAQLTSGDVPEVTEANIESTIDGFRQDARLIFQRGLARAFTGLDSRFKSHDAFRFEDRVIFERVFDGDGHISYYSSAFDAVTDVERVLAILDGDDPDPVGLRRLVMDSRRGWGARQSVCTSRYFRLRGFKNGNAHLWFTRPDLVEKANRVLADYYGAVLPDAAPADVEKPITGELAKSLQFYRTPAAVVDKIVHGLWLPEGSRVLEPSAGDGAIVAGVLKYEHPHVDAIEVDAGRAAALGRFGRRVTVLPANFLRVPARAEYEAVLMNPPFYGTHWMDHVRHAYTFLRPGGILRAVLPATAEVGRSSDHEAFRAWAEERSQYRRLSFTALPSESFAESGTRVQTVILELRGGA